MNTALPLSHAYATADTTPNPSNTHASAVSWGAIFAGAAAAASLSLILLILGTGLGFSAVSPWSQKGISAGGLGVSTIVWITLTQLIASGLGGYLAGRLRTRWLAAHQDEVYFRDTAHGFLAWAIASLATAALLTSVIGSITGAGLQAGASVTGAAAAVGASAIHSELAKPDADNTGTAYFMDSLFRVAPGAGPGIPPQPTGSSQQLSELTLIFMNTLRTGPLAPDDLAYAAQIVAQRTGLSQPDAPRRVSEVYARMQSRFTAAQNAAREAADTARKASATAALWLFVSLLAGAFIASWTATYGGRQRDL